MDQNLKFLLKSCRETDKNNFQKNLELNDTAEYEFLYWVANVINGFVSGWKSRRYISYFYDFQRYFILWVIDLLRNHINSASTNFRHSQESWIIFIYFEWNYEEIVNQNQWSKFRTKKWKTYSTKANKYLQKMSEKSLIFEKANCQLSSYKKFVNWV